MADELSNLAEFLYHAYEHDPLDGLEQWETAFSVYRDTWLIDDCDRLLHEVKSWPLDDAAHATVFEQKRLVYFERNDDPRADSYLNTAVTAFQSGGDRHGAGRGQEAIAWFQKANAVFEELGRQQSLSTNLSNLASVYHDLTLWKQAAEFYNQALQLK